MNRREPNSDPITTDTEQKLFSFSSIKSFIFTLESQSNLIKDCNADKTQRIEQSIIKSIYCNIIFHLCSFKLGLIDPKATQFVVVNDVAIAKVSPIAWRK